MDATSVISTISQAAKKQKIVTIRYRDKENHVTERETEPYEIKDGRYFGGTDKGIRGFSLDRIVSAQQTEISFSPKWPIKI